MSVAVSPKCPWPRGTEQWYLWWDLYFDELTREWLRSHPLTPPVPNDGHDFHTRERVCLCGMRHIDYLDRNPAERQPLCPLWEPQPV